MKIENVKINNYGNLRDKQINFDKINLIYGKNESGKSTLLSFLVNSLYGISKNKNKRDVSDYERYLPWEGEEYSGKIKYKLQSGKTYEVFRDFNKKNPEIYDEQLNDVSKKYTIDKKLGNQFFYDQTKIDEELLLSTVVTSQKQVKIDNATQNILIQKIANLSETGEEEQSFKKAIEKIDKSLLNEVGTEKSQERPINICKDNIKSYKEEIDIINESKTLKYVADKRENEINQELSKLLKNKTAFNRVKDLLNKNNNENDKIEIKSKIIEDNKLKIEKNNIEKKNLKSKINSKKIMLIAILISILNIVSLFAIKNKLINLFIFLLIPAFVTYYIIKKKKNNSGYLDAQNDILEKNNKELANEISDLKRYLLQTNQIARADIIKEYGEELGELFNSNIDFAIRENDEKINNLNLELHKLELDRENIEPKLDKLAKTEEKLVIEENKLNELEETSEIYGLTKKILQESYQEMKNTITPKFNSNLSENIAKLSNEKYKNISINDGVFVELKNGRYVSAENLSVGTIEQIYLALRLSIIKEISKEPLPIILDEAFAYYDDERLSSTLNFLANLDNQIFILSCTEREKTVLENCGQKFEFIEL